MQENKFSVLTSFVVNPHLQFNISSLLASSNKKHSRNVFKERKNKEIIWTLI